MIKEARSRDLIEGVTIGKDKIEVTHLPFADDRVVLNYRRLLDYFGLMSGLEINYHKSSIVYWLRDDSCCRSMSSVLHYKVEMLPIKYLWVP